MEEAAGLLTRGSLSHRLPGCRSPGAPVAFRRASNSPHSGGTVPESHRVPSPRSLVTVEPIIGRCRQQRFRAWAPVVLWAAVIFAFSSIPSLATGLGTWDLVLRKLAHLTEYAILGALLVRALAPPGARDPRRGPLRDERRDPPALRPRPSRSLVRRRHRHGRRRRSASSPGGGHGGADERDPDRPRRRARRHAATLGRLAGRGGERAGRRPQRPCLPTGVRGGCARCGRCRQLALPAGAVRRRARARVPTAEREGERSATAALSRGSGRRRLHRRARRARSGHRVPTRGDAPDRGPRNAAPAHWSAWRPPSGPTP